LFCIAESLWRPKSLSDVPPAHEIDPFLLSFSHEEPPRNLSFRVSCKRFLISTFRGTSLKAFRYILLPDCRTSMEPQVPDGRRPQPRPRAPRVLPLSAAQAGGACCTRPKHPRTPAAHWARKLLRPEVTLGSRPLAREAASFRSDTWQLSVDYRQL
jgi:hypothetical protein